jgi:hypothetical protein
MADTKTTAPTETVAAKKTQVSTTLTPAELTKLQDVRFSQRHEKLSETIAVAIREYVDKHLPQA